MIAMRALVVVLALAACRKEPATDVPPPPAVAPAILRAPRATPPTLTKVTIKALGMYCEESCPLKVRTALAEIPAVYQLGFDVSTEAIYVSYDASLGPAKDVTRPMLVAIKGAGFDPWLAKEAWPPEADAAVAVVP